MLLHVRAGGLGRGGPIKVPSIPWNCPRVSRRRRGARLETSNRVESSGLAATRPGHVSASTPVTSGFSQQPRHETRPHRSTRARETATKSPVRRAHARLRSFRALVARRVSGLGSSRRPWQPYPDSPRVGSLKSISYGCLGRLLQVGRHAGGDIEKFFVRRTSRRRLRPSSSSPQLRRAETECARVAVIELGNLDSNQDLQIQSLPT